MTELVNTIQIFSSREMLGLVEVGNDAVDDLIGAVGEPICPSVIGVGDSVASIGKHVRRCATWRLQLRRLPSKKGVKLLHRETFLGERKQRRERRGFVVLRERRQRRERMEWF